MERKTLKTSQPSIIFAIRTGSGKGNHLTKAAGIVAAIVLLFLAGGPGRASAQTLSTLYSFGGADGAWPEAGLVQGRDGNFYGTTQGGGIGC